MSPAPVRTSLQPRTFPYRGGYAVGGLLIVAGIVVAIVLAVNGFRALVDDVNDFRRAVGRDSLEETLQAGAEYIVYDEDGIDAGPFNVTVTRASDGAEVGTTIIENGPTYEVDGRRGRARVGFEVPTSDIYRIQLDTSAAQLARFAVGGDVTNVRQNAIVQGLVFGAVLVLLGLVVLMGTGALHARWKVRQALQGQVSTAREALRQGAEQVESGSEDVVAQVSARTHERLEQARRRLSGGTTAFSSGTDPGRPGWQESIAAQARQRIDQIDTELAQREPEAADAADRAAVARDAVERADQALSRIQQRLAEGEPLRTILRDERQAAQQAGRELAERARQTQTAATEHVRQAADAVADRGTAEGAALASDLTGIGSAAIEEAAAQAGSATDDLATGVAATAAGAATAAAAASADRLRAIIGTEPAGDTDQGDEAPQESEDAGGVRVPESGLPPPPPPPALTEPGITDVGLIEAVVDDADQGLDDRLVEAATAPVEELDRVLAEAAAPVEEVERVVEAAAAPVEEVERLVEAAATPVLEEVELDHPLERGLAPPAVAAFALAPPPAARPIATRSPGGSRAPSGADGPEFTVLAPPPAAAPPARTHVRPRPEPGPEPTVDAEPDGADPDVADDAPGSDRFVMAPPPPHRPLRER